MRKLNRNTSLERATEIAQEGDLYLGVYDCTPLFSRTCYVDLGDHQHVANARAINLVRRALELCNTHGLDFTDVRHAAHGALEGAGVHPVDVERCFEQGIPLYVTSR